MAIPGALRFLANVQETDKIIYPPAKHAQMICALYENFGIKPVIGNTSAEAGNKQPTIMEMSVNNKLSLALIRFLQYGEDFEQRIHETLYRVKREGIQVVQVRLNLEDPQTSIVAEQLEKKGFIFTGILPGTTGGDLMSMQYFNGIAVDYDAIHVFSNRGQELLDYIRRHDTMGGIN
jgi:serine/threonine-protein kinase RsbW